MSSLSGSPGLSDVCATVLLPSSSSVLKAERCPSFNRKHRRSWAALLCFVGVPWHPLLRELPLWYSASASWMRFCAFSHWITRREKGCISEGPEASDPGLGQGQVIWGESLSTLTRCIWTLRQKVFDGGKYLQRGGSEVLRFSTWWYLWNS